MTKNFTVVLEKEEEGGYHAFCPALKGCHSEGETIDTTLTNIREAIEVYVESLRAHGEPIPDEDVLFKSMPVTV